MNRLALGSLITTALLRYGLSLGAAAALLTGCGGSQIPRSASPQGLMPQQSHADDAYNILHEFGVSHKDGTNPSAELINVKGTLYGTTVLGGSHGIGTVFSITKNGKKPCCTVSAVRLMARNLWRGFSTSMARSTAQRLTGG